MFKIKGILSFPHLFQARAVNPGDDPKYSLSVLIPKGDPQIALIEAAIAEAKANGFPSGFPPNGKVCLKDCAIQFPNRPEQLNYMVITLTSGVLHKPVVCDANLQPIIDPGEVFPGADAEVAITIKAYKGQAFNGVGGYVNGVKVLGTEGALGRLDSSQTAEQMFGGVSSPPPTTAAPTAPAAPAAPAAPPAPGAPAAPQYQMTAKANGVTRETFLATPGWTEELLISEGMMVMTPGGVPTRF